VKLFSKDLSILTHALTSEIALLAVKIWAELAVKGTLVEPADVFVGATYIQNGLQLLTSNMRHFEQLVAYGLLLHGL
jgi:predicted nucleic acid-binding protein